MNKEIVKKIKACGTDSLTKEKTLQAYERLCNTRKNIKELEKLCKEKEAK